MNRPLLALAWIAAVSCQIGTAWADPNDDAIAGLQRCKSVGDDKARLACYDSLATPTQTAAAQSPETAQSPPASSFGQTAPTKAEEKSWFGFDMSGLFGSSPSQQTTPQQFGSEKLPSTRAREEAASTELDQISARVTNYAYTPFGKFIVFLDNGQIWKQIEGDSGQAVFHKTPTDNTVVIARGLIGSYNLYVNGSSATFKVDRIK
jgi:hypothetical protein